jgi:hypothetical protein
LPLNSGTTFGRLSLTTHPEIKTDQFTSLTRIIRFETLWAGLQLRTITEESLNELILNAKREQYYEMHKDLFTDLENDLTHSLDQDLLTFKKEITELLEDEILGRYFYEEGAIAKSIMTDDQVLKAAEILKNKDLYNSILQGKTSPLLVSRENEKTLMITGHSGEMDDLQQI